MAARTMAEVIHGRPIQELEAPPTCSFSNVTTILRRAAATTLMLEMS